MSSHLSVCSGCNLPIHDHQPNCASARAIDRGARELSGLHAARLAPVTQPESGQPISINVNTERGRIACDVIVAAVQGALPRGFPS